MTGPAPALVPESIDDKGVTDVSGAVNAWLAKVPNGKLSDHPQVIQFPAHAKYRIDSTLINQDRHNLKIQGGGYTEFFAGSPGDSSRAQWKFINGSDITMSNLTIRGANPQALLSGVTEQKEGQHGITVLSTERFTAFGLEIFDTFSEFIYFGNTENGPRPKDCRVIFCKMQYAGRMGISFNGAEGLEVALCNISDVKRSTFDSEPHNSRWGAYNVHIHDNTIGPGRLTLFAAGGSGEGRGGDMDNILFERNILKGKPMWVIAEAPAGTKRSNLAFVDNESDVLGKTGVSAMISASDWNGVLATGNIEMLKQRTPQMYLVRTSNCTDVHVHDNDVGQYGGQWAEALP